MAVPEASMDKYAGSDACEYNVGFAGQVCSMDTKAVSMRMKESPNYHFRICILPSYATHHSGSSGMVDNIHVVISQSIVVS